MNSINERGFATITTVILFGVVAVGMVVSVLALSLRSNKTSLAKDKYHQARALAVACGEHAVYALRVDLDNPLVVSPLPAFSDGNCSVSISGTGNTNRIIDVTATTDQSTFRIRTQINSVLPVTHLTSWEEVSS